jgi:hypothetical protein
MDTLKDLLIRDEEGEETAFLLAIFIVVVAVGIGLLIVYIIYNLIVQVIGINPQFWKMWVAGLSTAFLQGPIYRPSMDEKLIEGWQLVQPVAITVVLVLILYFFAIWVKSRGRRFFGQVLQRTCIQQGGWSSWPRSKKAMLVIFATGVFLSVLIRWHNYPYVLATIALMLVFIGGLATVYSELRRRKE